MKGGFDVAPLVVALHEASLIEGIKVKHSFPNRGVVLTRDAIRLERDIGHSVMVNDRLQVVARQIGFVGAHFGHREVAPGRFNQPLELRAIVSVTLCDFDGGDNIRFDPAHQVNLNPLAFGYQLRVGIFGVNPLEKPRS